ncbi:hypothetical protein BDQ12DRAFT_184901 [Crucibulum laeve]|uniref:Long-chain-fatty-acid-CoA ligase n=1 Tax=Crucibulum laeve TaxID=68775 RepID=A0A5C3ME96_9AGAR|nr:hypothetical protein BDQ12DRAFT_184901 [Crucibulum laeve]
MSWSPKRTLAECDAILLAPGTMHEMQTCLIDGRLQRVYKKLWPSLRVFWLWAANEHSNATYLVFGDQRYTFKEVFNRSVKAAAVLQDVYHVQKGDRVALCSRNYPEYLVAFWACHLIGAVSVLVNAWSPLETLRYCLVNTQSKVIIVDSERADLLEPIAKKLAADAGTTGFLVLEAQDGKGKWEGIQNWNAVLDEYTKDTSSILKKDPGILPEDDATILFTSGTTGLPKGVLSTQRAWLTNVFNVLVGGLRAAFRRGEDAPAPPTGPQKGILLSVPLFHVTGSASLLMMASMVGLKIIIMRKWDPEEAARLIKQENITIAGGVPSMVADLVNSSVAGHPLEGLMFGGAPAPDSLAARARTAFPAATMSQGYGLTETNSVAVGFGGEDYVARPASCGIAAPVNDIMIMNGDVAAPAGTVGEVWLKGPNVMKEYWGDHQATAKALTKDGWFKTGDLGLLDEEGFLYIRDRIKDIIIRGGENIDSVSVENALYADERLGEVAAVGVPDERLGEQVAAVVTVKPAHRGQVTEASLIALARKSLPKYAIPVMILIQDEPFELTPSGKILKANIRKVAKAAWEKRLKEGPKAKL